MIKNVTLDEYLDTKLERQIIQEENGKPAVYKLKGVFQRGDAPNGNRRVYPSLYLQREVDRLKPLIEQRKIVGELDHPVNREKPLYSEASHVITHLEMRGKEIYGELEILYGTDKGRNLLGLFQGGVSMGISSRGTGGLRPLPGGLFEVDESLVINTWDIVSEPSVADAILHEGLVINNRLMNKSKKPALYYFNKALS